MCDKHKQSKQTGVLPCTGTVPVVHGVRTSLTPPLICPLEVFLNDMRYINPRFTYLLTYLQDARFVPKRRGGAAAVAVHRAVRYGPSTSAPQYMTDCCIHTSGIARRQHLRSAGCHQLFVPRHRRSMFGRRASSVAGRLPVTRYQTTYLRDPSRSFDTFLRDLKNFSLRLFAI